jgi:putative proteasome-type protease
VTYCVGLRLNKGLVFMSDTRTNSGIDNISVFRKMFQRSTPGERVITIVAARNLATTQSVVSLVDERSKAHEDRQPSILQVPTMFQIANLVGGLLRDSIAHSAPTRENSATFGASLIVGAQIKGMDPRLFLIYPEGNIHRSDR